MCLLKFKHQLTRFALVQRRSERFHPQHLIDQETLLLWKRPVGPVPLEFGVAFFLDFRERSWPSQGR